MAKSAFHPISSLPEIDSPLDVVREIFGQALCDNVSLAETQSRVADHFRRVLHNDAQLAKVPSLNFTPASQLRPNTLVRFRCMVQGLEEQEVYVAASEITHSATGQKEWICGLYTDEVCEALHTGAAQLNEASQRFGDKDCYYCVSIPAESAWVKKAYKEESCLLTAVDEMAELTRRMSLENHGHQMDEAHARYAASRYPFPEQHVSSIVKVYDRRKSFEITEQVEFIGILGVAYNSIMSDDQQYTTMADAFRSKAPPRLPRIHAIMHVPVRSNNNPLVPRSIGIDQAVTSITHNRIRQNIREIRRSAISMIKAVLGGDPIAAEFVLLQLFSRVHSWQGDTVLGSLSLNLANIPLCEPVVDADGNPVASSNVRFSVRCVSGTVAELVESLVPKCHPMPLTLDALNKGKFCPSSSGDNGLDAGVLQVTRGTWFVIDETALREGMLLQQGVKNVQALKNALERQTVDYVFPFSPIKFNTDIAFLVLSSCKSLLPVHCLVPLADECAAEACRCLSDGELSDTHVPETTMDAIREYLGVFRISSPVVPEDVATYIQDEFVSVRKAAADAGLDLPITDVDLNLRLRLARLVSASFGQEELTREMWDYTCRLDEQRKERVKEFAERRKADTVREDRRGV